MRSFCALVPMRYAGPLIQGSLHESRCTGLHTQIFVQGFPGPCKQVLLHRSPYAEVLTQGLLHRCAHAGNPTSRTAPNIQVHFHRSPCAGPFTQGSLHESHCTGLCPQILLHRCPHTYVLLLCAQVTGPCPKVLSHRFLVYMSPRASPCRQVLLHSFPYPEVLKQGELHRSAHAGPLAPVKRPVRTDLCKRTRVRNTV